MVIQNENFEKLSKLYKFKHGLGKISIIRDPELKFRAIAMLDYASQSVLKPIHDILLIKINNLPQDRTFTQNPFNN